MHRLDGAEPPPFQFVDEQLSGPYRFWRNLSTFEQVDGQTAFRDQ
jgi:ligand-binding SRPBCC domain-containing protein